MLEFIPYFRKRKEKRQKEFQNARDVFVKSMNKKLVGEIIREFLISDGGGLLSVYFDSGKSLSFRRLDDGTFECDGISQKTFHISNLRSRIVNPILKFGILPSSLPGQLLERALRETAQALTRLHEGEQISSCFLSAGGNVTLLLADGCFLEVCGNTDVLEGILIGYVSLFNMFAFNQAKRPSKKTPAVIETVKTIH